MLRWFIDGARAYLAEGLHPPAKVVEQTAAYRTAEDSFAGVLGGARRHRQARHRTSGRRRSQGAANGCEANGFRAMRANDVAEELQARGFERRRTNAGAIYHGFRLRDPGEE